LGHFQPEILRTATHFVAGWLQKLTQIQLLDVSQLPAGNTVRQLRRCMRQIFRIILRVRV
jgi:hypothetical protein